MKIELFPSSSGRTLDEAGFEELRDDLAAEVGPAHFVEGPATANAKGGALAAVLGIAITVLGTPAVGKLIDLLKAYLVRDRSFEFTIEHPGGKMHIKSADFTPAQLDALGSHLASIAKGQP